MFNRSNFETHVYLTAFLVLFNGIILIFLCVCVMRLADAWQWVDAIRPKWRKEKCGQCRRLPLLASWKRQVNGERPFYWLMALDSLFSSHASEYVSCNQWRLFALIQSKCIVFLAECWCRLHRIKVLKTFHYGKWLRYYISHYNVGTKCVGETERGRVIELTH